ncbi:MAG: permease-like cell division protein FtsX, partial [Pseudomonadota bacterium]
MIKLRTLAYFFKYACINILNNRLIHAISVGTISVSLLLFGIFMLFFVNVNHWMLEWGQSLSMSVYLQEGVDKQTKEKLEETLKNLPGAEIKGYVSKEKAEQELIEALGDQAGLLDALSKNPLPASFEIVFRDVIRNPVDPKKIKADLEKKKGVNEVQYSEQWLERFEGILYMIKVGGFFLGGLLCLAVLFIITNTIKLMIYARRDEITIYKLVGATDWFIK